MTDPLTPWRAQPGTSGMDRVLAQLAQPGETIPMGSINLAHLSDLPRQEISRFDAAWSHLTPARRLELIAAMVGRAEANIHLNFHLILRGCLADPDARIRKLAIEGLWEDERVSLIRPLCQLLASDPEAEVRSVAAISLGRFVLRGVLGEIAETAAEQSEQALRSAWSAPREVTIVRRRALESLAYSNAPTVQGLIDAAYYDEEELMRQSAVFAMGRTADRRWSRFVLRELGSPEASMRHEAAASAGELKLAPAVRPLVELLDDPDPSVREAVVMALGKIGGPVAQRVLQQLLLAEGDDQRLVETAEVALEELRFNQDDVSPDTLAAGGHQEDAVLYDGVPDSEEPEARHLSAVGLRSRAPDEDLDWDPWGDLDEIEDDDYPDTLAGRLAAGENELYDDGEDLLDLYPDGHRRD